MAGHDDTVPFREQQVAPPGDREWGWDRAGLLLDFDADASLEALAASWGGRILYRAGAAVDRLGLGALLVRPDGVVAWARDAGAAPDRDGAVQAASRWFGQPAA